MPILVSRASAATVSFSTPQEIIISHVDDSIRLGDGTTLVNVTLANELKTSDADTHAKLDAANASLDAIEASVAAIDTNTDTVESKLQSIIDNTDTVETKLQSIMDNTDTVETKLQSIIDNTDTVETKLQSIIDNTDTVETKLQSIIDNTDTIEATLSDIEAGIPEALGQTTMSASMPVTVASDQTPIPTNSEPQRDSVGGRNFSVFADGINAQAAETKLFSVENPSGSDVDIHIYALCNFVDPNNNNWCKFRYYTGNTTPTAGTLVTPRNIKAGGATDSTTVVRTLPTVTTLGNVIAVRAGPAGNTMGALYPGELIQAYWILPPNTNLVVTGTAKANNVPVFITLEYIRKASGT